MNDLFTKKPAKPLAEILRPQSINDVVGQDHLLGDGQALRMAFDQNAPHSMILWGPPGVGKTTIARLCADAFECHFIALSAVFSGVKDIRGAMDEAQSVLDSSNKATILFIDEIHRFNKSQQDALLPYVENGLVTFIGATTENPSFEVNSALLSRAQTYVLKSLDHHALIQLIDRANDFLSAPLNIPNDIKDRLVELADGDGRRLIGFINLLDQAVANLDDRTITMDIANKLLSSGAVRFDKGGEHFYDQISALHKSVRGSNPDGALYWFTRMLEGGADPKYLSRRIIRMAYEDIGLADPRAFNVVNEAAATYERLGSPEGELALAQAVIYLAVAPKSNAGYNAYNQARAFVKNHGSNDVPIHLRNAPTKLMKELGYGKEYRYAHDEPHAYAAGETYFPEDIKPQNWYQPVSRGQEIKIGEKLEFLRNLDKKAKN